MRQSRSMSERETGEGSEKRGKISGERGRCSGKKEKGR
jgi:hypothetical protein